MLFFDTFLEPIEANEFKNAKGVFQIKPKDAEETTDMFTTDLTKPVKLRMDGPGSLAKSAPVTIHTVFARTVEESSDDVIALKYKYKHEDKYNNINYLQYYQLCCLTAKSFIKIGLEPRNSVCIAGFNSVPWMLSYFGAIFADGVASGVYTTNNTETVTYIVANCNCQVAVVENDELAAKYVESATSTPSLKAVVQFHGSITEQRRQQAKNIQLLSWIEFMKLSSSVPDSELHARLMNMVPNKCCSLIYTSGTTGSPKGVMMSHDNLLWTGMVLQAMLHFRKGKEELISYLPLSHVAAQMCDIILPIIIQATIWYAQPDALKGSLSRTLREAKPTQFIGVPRVFEKMQEAMREAAINHSALKKCIGSWAKDIGLRSNLALMNKEAIPLGYSIAKLLIFNKVRSALGLDRCKGCYSAAAPMSLETIHYFASLDIILVEIYGMSECSGPQTVGKVDCFLFSSVGKVVPEFRMKLASNEGIDGEVCMSGRHIFMGYLGSKEKTEEVFDADFYLHSGDVGTIDSDGYLFITGRIKELLITAGGENVAPVPIEEKIKENLPFISNVLVVGDRKKYLIALFSIRCEQNNETQTPTDQITPAAQRWLKSKGYTGEKVSLLINEMPPAICSEVDNAIKIVNDAAVSKAAYVQKWKFLPKDFSVGGGELGPTLKVKRGHITKLYTELIDSVYKD